MKRIISLIIALFLLLPFAISCNNDESSATLISFSEAASVDYLKTLNGKKVSIIGYVLPLPRFGKLYVSYEHAVSELSVLCPEYHATFKYDGGVCKEKFVVQIYR